MLVPERTTNVFGRSPFVTVTAGPAPIVTLSTAVEAVTSPPRLVALKVTKRPTAPVRPSESPPPPSGAAPPRYTETWAECALALKEPKRHDPANVPLKFPPAS